MKKYKLKLDFKDPGYNRALHRAIVLKTDCFEFVDGISPDGFRIDDTQVDDLPDITLNESNISLFLPVRTIISQTMAMLNCQTGPVKPIENVIFTGFCSGVGGSGLTTAALCYANIISRIYGRKTVFCSFDPWYRQKFPERNEFDVVFVSNIEDAAGSDELVLDIPFGAGLSFREQTLGYHDLLDMCDRRIVVMGFDEKTYRWRRGSLVVPVWKYDGEILWGMTARMVIALLKYLNE